MSLTPQTQSSPMESIQAETSGPFDDDGYDFEIDIRNSGLGVRSLPVASLLLLAQPCDDKDVSVETADSATASSSHSSPSTNPQPTPSSQSSPCIELSPPSDADLIPEFHPALDAQTQEMYKIHVGSLLATWKHLCPKVGVTVMLNPNPGEARIHHWNHWIKEIWGWSEANTYSWYDLVHPSEYFRLCRRIHWAMTSKEVHHVGCNYVSVPHTFPRPQQLVDRTIDVLNTPTCSSIGLNAVECIRRSKEEEKNSQVFEFYHESFPVRSPTYPHKLLYAISLIYFM